jgi:hypothetical protein
MRDDRALNRHGAQSADDSGGGERPVDADGSRAGRDADGAGAKELDAEIARRESGGGTGQPGTGLGAGLTQRPPD